MHFVPHGTSTALQSRWFLSGNRTMDSSAFIYDKRTKALE